MKVSLEYDDTRSLVTFVVTGEPDADTFIEVMKECYARPDYLDYTRNLWDMREMPFQLSRTEGIKRFSSFLTKERPRGDGRSVRAAMVVEGTLAFGLSRMFSLMTEDPDMEIEVFTSIDEAKSWLLAESGSTDA